MADYLRVRSARSLSAVTRPLQSTPSWCRSSLTPLRGLRDTLADPNTAFESSLKRMPELSPDNQPLQRDVLTATLEYYKPATGATPVLSESAGRGRRRRLSPSDRRLSARARLHSSTTPICLWARPRPTWRARGEESTLGLLSPTSQASNPHGGASVPSATGRRTSWAACRSYPPLRGAIGAALALWAGWATDRALLPAYVLPPPSKVLAAWLQLVQNGALWRHVSATLSEALAGFAVALLAGCALAYPLAKSETLSRWPRRSSPPRRPCR